MKIIDCFIFFNELKLLEFRLEYLYNHVDHFVIVESNMSFVGNPKEFNFVKHKNIYEKYIDKIMYIKVKDMPNTGNPWDNETHQRNCIKRGLEKLNLKDTDRVLIGDLDEIPDINTFSLILNDINYNMLMQNYIYDIEHLVEHFLCEGTKAVTYKTVMECNNYHYFRKIPYTHYIISGWHLSYFGNVSFIKNKLQNFSHTNYAQQPDTFYEKCFEDKTKVFVKEHRNIIKIPIEYNIDIPVIDNIGIDNTKKILLEMSN